MSWQEHISVDPNILAGTPVIEGTQQSAEFIIELLAQDCAAQQILDTYPGITQAALSACLHYADSSRLSSSDG